jgi:hypothetical protein
MGYLAAPRQAAFAPPIVSRMALIPQQVYIRAPGMSRNSAAEYLFESSETRIPYEAFESPCS